MRTILYVLSLFVLLTGCNQQSSPQTKARSAEEDPLCNPTPVRYFHVEQKAKAIAQQVDGVDQAVAVQIDDELDVAIQVSNFNRLKLESIRKEVARKLKAAFSKTKVHVSSDQKVIDELQKLSDTPWSVNAKDACQQKKKLKQIEKLMRG